jgi:hypothetical protein
MANQVLTYTYVNLFPKVVGAIRHYFNLPFFEQGSASGGGFLQGGVGIAVSGSTTLVSCGVDSPQKQNDLIRLLFAELGGPNRTFGNQDEYGGYGSQGATTYQQVEAPLVSSAQPGVLTIGNFVTIDDVANYLANYY